MGFRPFVSLVFYPSEYAFDGMGVCQVLEKPPGGTGYAPQLAYRPSGADKREDVLGVEGGGV